MKNKDNFLEAKNIEKSFKSRQVVKGISLSLWPGEIIGLLGPNGSGKTTTFNIIIGHIKADKGSVLLNKVDISTLAMHKRARLGLGYLPQESSIFRKLTVEENILIILETLKMDVLERKSKVDSLLLEFHLTHLKHQKAGILSGGERRRLEIARTIARSPSYILLDEPFAGVDPITVAEIQTIIACLSSKGIGIIITDHNVRETLEITHRSYIIYKGEVIVKGSSHDLINDPAVKKFYLGDNFKM